MGIYFSIIILVARQHQRENDGKDRLTFLCCYVTWHWRQQVLFVMWSLSQYTSLPSPHFQKSKRSFASFVSVSSPSYLAGLWITSLFPFWSFLITSLYGSFSDLENICQLFHRFSSTFVFETLFLNCCCFVLLF